MPKTVSFTLSDDEHYKISTYAAERGMKISVLAKYTLFSHVLKYPQKRAKRGSGTSCGDEVNSIETVQFQGSGGNEERGSE